MSSALSVQVGGDHYKGSTIQPVQFFHANDLDWFQGSICKYVCRWRDKGGLQDLYKARHTLDLYIELEEARATPATTGLHTPD